jgi:pyruvate dehydrogenase E2 component (dihydrolipoamide acetyltransferase)
VVDCLRLKPGAVVACITAPGAEIPQSLRAAAAREHPTLNARLDGDRIVHNSHINIGFTADAANGLMVPVVRDAATHPLQEIAADFVILSRKTDNKELTAIDVTDGTFTATSLEAFQVDAFTPILNPPQTAILGIGRVRKQPVAANDGIEIGQITTPRLTFDHRVVDGAPAARFLGRVSQLLERPYMLCKTHRLTVRSSAPLRRRGSQRF